MDELDIRNKYIEWISELIFPIDSYRQKYSKLIEGLHSIGFTSVFPMDMNRIMDGVDLRYRFGYETRVPIELIDEFLYKNQCTVLEVMVALCLRCEENIMYDDQYGDRTSVWFKQMMISMHIDTLTDDKYDKYLLFDRVQIMMSHRYSEDGEGGLFTVKNCTQDMRDLELWKQMCLYLNSIID